MTGNLNREIANWTEAEYPTEVVSAPKDAVSFDKMLVVYLDETRRFVRRVSFYNSKTDKFIAHF